MVAYDSAVENVDIFLRGAAADRPNVVGARSVEELVVLLPRPRKIVLTVAPGSAADELIELLVPHLDSGDLVVDAGNSHYADTIRRAKRLEAHGMLFIGAGVTAGEDAAFTGPAIVAGGSPGAWPLVREMLQSIAARSPAGEPCCEWVGEGGAGHFVKATHNGLEYAEMQLICEAYHLLSEGLGLTARETNRVFVAWAGGELDSYLIDITADILAYEDERGAPLLDSILDAAAQQGTGAWAVASSLELGVPATLMGEAVFARSLSAMKEDRVGASATLSGPTVRFEDDRAEFVEDLRHALVASRIVSYTQGHMLLSRAAEEHGWSLDYRAIATVWQGGRILRSSLLAEIREAFAESPGLGSLILDDRFREVVDRCQPSWRRVVATGAGLGVPTPAISAALAFYDGYRSARLPTNLLQAQRDYFGAHTYERIDRDRGLRFHTDWTGRSG